jgi:two-component system OmpR family sensor kinase
MSLRSRLLLGLAFVAVVLVAAAVFVATTTRAHLIDQVDEQLASVAGRFPAGPRAFPSEDGFVAPEDGTIPPPSEEALQLSPLYVGFLTAEGDMVTISAPNLADEDAALPALDRDRVAAAARSGEPFITGSASDTRYRVQATVNDTLGGIDVVALPLDDTDAAISRLIAVEAVATLVALGVLALVAWWVIRLGVRPIKQMTESAAAIAEGTLSSRVPEGDPSTEAGELGAALNLMLDRIEGAFNDRARTEERLRRFVADASHELRTPVTTIRGYADLYRHGGLQQQAELDDAMRRTEQEAARMGALVEDMLQLARLDQGRPLHRNRVDLSVLARDAVADARATDSDRPIGIQADDPAVVIGDSDRLRQVLANLVANALVHTPSGTPVRVRTSVDAANALLEVSDDGPGMPKVIADQVFERFFRGEPSRSRSQGGSGLGLSIVQAIVTGHGGHISLRSRPDQGTTVQVTLPVHGL